MHPAVVLDDIATQHIADHPPIRILPADAQRFEEQEHAARQVGVRIVAPADVVDQIMAESQAAEGRLRPRPLDGFLLQAGLDAQGILEMIRIGAAIDQEYPIEVAPGRQLPAGQRSEDDDARVLRGERRKGRIERSDAILGSHGGGADGGPFHAELLSELTDRVCGVHVFR